jgi:regulation of enolase protein 1 (concanavalin A-like superfamily)
MSGNCTIDSAGIITCAAGSGDITDVGDCASGDCDLQTLTVGDGASGNITWTFDGDAGDDGTFVWDTTEDDFTFNEKVEINTSPANAADPVLHLQDLSDTNDNLVMDIQGNNRADPFGQDNDEAYVVYKLDDDLGNTVEMARITWKIIDASNASIDSEYEIETVSAGTSRDRLSIRGAGLIINEDSIDSNVRIESNNNQYLALLDGGLDTVTIGSQTSLGLLGVDGQSDEIQLVVQGVAGQTANLFVVESDSGSDRFVVDANGLLAATALTGLTDVASNTQGAGRILVSDGTDFDSLSISGDITIDSAGLVAIAGAKEQDTKCIWFEDPTAADDFESVIVNKTSGDWSITEYWAESDQTVTFHFSVDDGTPAVIDSVDLAPAAGEAEDTSLNGDTTLGADEELDLGITSVTNTPTWFSACITFERN